jgi:peptidyl-prolyl cis-trans isomerase D
MLSAFRNFLKSKIGMVAALIFLGVIALAFASMDVSSTGTFGGLSGAERVALVGDEEINVPELQTNINRQVELQRQQNPGMSREAFVENGGFESVLDRMIRDRAIAEFGRSIGLRAGDRLVDSRLVRMPEFRNAGGNFDPNVYRQVLSQVGYTDKLMRTYLGDQLLQQQVMVPVVLNSRMPESLVRRYSALQKERRTGQIAGFPAAAFAPKGDPTDAQLRAFYTANRTDYMRPERRVLRYAAFGEEALKGDIKPTEAEIKAAYDRDIAQYRAAELRTLTTLIVPLASGETVARAIRQEVIGGKTLEAAARGRSLSTTKGEPMEKAAVSTRDSAAVANAAFATAQGQVSQPVRGRLGFYLVRVDAIQQKAGRSLDAVRGEIAAALTLEKRRSALLDLSESIENAVDEGSNLLELADAYGLTVQTTPPLLSNGAAYGQPGTGTPELLRPVVSTAFLMEEGQPQLDELIPGTAFLVYDVSEVTQAAPAPLAEIKEVVTAAWRMEEGAKAAEAAAKRVLKLVQQGKSFAEAMAAEKVALPAPEPIDMNRSQLSDLQSVPAPLALVFSMAKGTAKPLDMGNNAGWVVVKLDNIEPGKLVENDPELLRVGQQLHAVLADEQSREFVSAIEDEVGVERNQSTIDTVKSALSGRGS